MEHRLFYKLGDGPWDIPALRQWLEAVLPGKTTFTDFKVAHVFPGLGPKVLLLNARRLKRAAGAAGKKSSRSPKVAAA